MLVPFDGPLGSVVLPYGLTCLAAHIVLVVVFKHVLPPYDDSSKMSPTTGKSSTPLPPPWKTVPSFTAHQIVAFYLMTSWTISGIYYNYYYYSDDNGSNDSESSTDDETKEALKLFQIHHGGLIMAQRSMAALWIWDIPVMTFGIKKAQSDNSRNADLIMHLHHVGMLIICCIMVGLLSYDRSSIEREDTVPLSVPVPIGSCYAPVFLGIVEFSSIPLQLVDLFHPHKGQGHWYNYINSNRENDIEDHSNSENDNDSDNGAKFKSTLRNLNELCRQLFAFLFLIVRGIYFPYVVVGDVVPNIWEAFRVVYPKHVIPLSITFVFSVGFTLLQMYWTILVVQQILKALKGRQPKQPPTGTATTTTTSETQKATANDSKNTDTEGKKSK